jgi:hypothetical protein
VKDGERNQKDLCCDTYVNLCRGGTNRWLGSCSTITK